VGLVVVALVGVLIYLVGLGGTNEVSTGGESPTARKSKPKDGNGSVPVTPTPDVSVAVDAGELVDGRGSATVRVQNLQGDSDGGNLTITVAGGTSIEACDQEGLSEVTCPVGSLSPEQEVPVPVSFSTDSDGVTVTGEFNPKGDDENSGNNSDSADVLAKVSVPPEPEPEPEPRDGGVDTSTPTIESPIG
jgi:hypothetical protein